MQLLMTVQYYKLLFSKEANVSELIKAFDGAMLVDEKGGYGEPRKFIPTEAADLQIQLINDDDVRLPENQDGTYEQYHKVATERDSLKTKVKELEDKLKKIQEATKEESVT